MNVTIAPLREDEVEALCTLAAEIWRHHYPPIIGTAQTEYMLAQRYQPRVIRAELASGTVWWDVLRDGSELAGFASSFVTPEHELKLDKLYVHPRRQRGGLGGMLIAHTCGRARELGCRGVVLAVNKHNDAAIAAYLKHGFAVRESVVKDIGGGFVMDDYVMAISMKLKFTKMHGLGNDFVVLDATSQSIALTREQLRFIADRHFGIGCDQILQVEPARDSETDFYYRIFNADGGEVEQCGNGARCFVRYVHERGLTDKRQIRVGTAGGVIVPRLEADGRVSVDMGVPRFAPEEVPFIAPTQALTYSLELGNRSLDVSVLSMGNPHAVQIVSDVAAAPVASEGPQIEAHPRFPNRVNAGFMEIVDEHRIRLRVYERGAGETLACGTGACAAVVAGITRGLLAHFAVVVETRGGELLVSWAGEGLPVIMTGPAVTVFEGEVEVP